MQTLSTQSLLAAWELGSVQSHVVQRALALLASAYPDVPPGALAELAIGERDSILFGLREQIFGSQINALAVCPKCGARLELKFETADLIVCQAPREEEELQACLGEYQITFRLPNSVDLAALAEVRDIEEGKQRLLERVTLRVLHREEEVPVAQLPEEVVAGLEEQMGKADPQADVQLYLSCQSCGNRWEAALDIVHFLWSEIDAWAVRILREVHSLARAYGWREADILSMSAWRRQCYLEMLVDE